LWNSETFVDFEHSLNSAIKKLRAALGDSPENARYIETLPRVGYRFIAPVEEVSANVEFPAERRAASENVPTAGEGKESHHKGWPAFLGVFAILVTATVGFLVWANPRARLRSSGGQSMLAVIPFENLTGDTGQDYLSDGLTEEMIGQLGDWLPSALV